jgi:Glycerol dehydrogenase and related enzymes
MFDKSTWIKLPRNVVVGHGVLDELGQAVAELHLHGDPLVVTSPTPNEIAGDRLRTQLDNPSTVVVESASFDSIERVVDIADDEDAGYLLALGGGKAIDIAKMAADEIDRGFVSVPTAASHDGIVSGGRRSRRAIAATVSPLTRRWPSSPTPNLSPRLRGS